MIKFEKIKPGMVLYDVRRARSPSRWKWDTWQVKVVDVDVARRRALVSWNWNPAEWLSEEAVCRFRAARPKQEIR